MEIFTSAKTTVFAYQWSSIFSSYYNKNPKQKKFADIILFYFEDFHNFTKINIFWRQSFEILSIHKPTLGVMGVAAVLISNVIKCLSLQH